MGRTGTSRPSPAIVVAVLALVAALTGTAVAGPDAITSALTTSKVKKIAKKQAKKQIKKRVLTSEPYHEVGTAGEPDFENGWENWTDQPNFATAGFYKDPLGVVHLKGTVDGGANQTTIFTLPSGYRPARNLREAIFRGSGAEGMIIRATGELVVPAGALNASLDGVTFRAGE